MLRFLYAAAGCVGVDGWKYSPKFSQDSRELFVMSLAERNTLMRVYCSKCSDIGTYPEEP